MKAKLRQLQEEKKTKHRQDDRPVGRLDVRMNHPFISPIRTIYCLLAKKIIIACLCVEHVSVFVSQVDGIQQLVNFN